MGHEQTQLAAIVAKAIGEISGCAGNNLLETPLKALGIDSMGTRELQNLLDIQGEIPASNLHSGQTLITWLEGRREPIRPPGHLQAAPSEAVNHTHKIMSHEAVAIVGLACRFAEVNDPESYWNLVCEGRTTIRQTAPAPRQYLQQAGAYLANVAAFDASFFGMSIREARLLDPQQRLLLEVTWEALERAAIDPSTLKGSCTGIYTALGNRDYEHLSLNQPASPWQVTGNAAALSAGRLAHYYGTHGPAMLLETACSSSLVALHRAYRDLRTGDIEAALVAGVNLILTPWLGKAYRSAGMLSPTGHCRPFDASANGYVRGEGGVSVVLKRLADATRDGNPVLALIAGSAINQDGAGAAQTAPNRQAQEALYREALADASLLAEAVSYVEAHGTGTPLGDRTESASLAAVYGKEQPVWIGSAKANIGHTEAAAGLAGLVKIVLALSMSYLPAQTGIETPHPDHPDNLRLLTAGETWTGADRVAALSSFGISGTNAHVLLRPAPHQEETKASEKPYHLLILSAKDETALRQLALRLGKALDQQPIEALCHTLACGRAHHPYRLTVIAANLQELVHQLPQATVQRIPEMLPRVILYQPELTEPETPATPWATWGIQTHRITGEKPTARNDVILLERPKHWRDTLQQLARLYEAGVPIDWQAFYRNEPRSMLALPTYPFQHKDYWLDTKSPAREPKPHLSLEKLVCETLRLVLHRSEPIDPGETRGLFDLGLDSLSATDLRDRLSQALGLDLPATLAFDHTSPKTLIAYLAEQADSKEPPLPKLEHIAIATFVATLERLGTPLTQGTLIDLPAFVRTIDAKHRTYMANLFDHLTQAGYLSETREGWRVLKTLPDDPDDLLTQARASYPELAASLAWLTRCGEVLLEVLRGEIEPLQLLFPANKDEDAYQLYRESLDTTGIGEQLRQAFGQALTNAPASPRILEVGAGTGAATATLIDLVPATATYLYTDISTSFLRWGKARLGHHTPLSFQRYDLESDTVLAGPYHIIVAANVLHATASLERTLPRIRQQLAPGGTLILVEATRRRAWIDLTWGLFDGWWRYRDGRNDHPLLEAHRWVEQLRAQGFEHINHTPEDSSSHFPQVVLSASTPTREATPDQHSGDERAIAVIGIGCRFPGAEGGPETYWQLLLEGQAAISQRTDNGQTQIGGFLTDPYRFDAAFFAIPEAQAVVIDPQQRLLLEVAWQTCEHALIPPATLRNTPTGVYIGLTTADYSERILARATSAPSAHDHGSVSRSSAAGRLAHQFGLQGPTLVVDTACSSSLIAVHLACRALRSGEIDTALAGGVGLILGTALEGTIQRAGILSPTGRSRSFAAEADGYGRGEGCGLVLLKRQSDARAAGDRILATILGSATNHNGAGSAMSVPDGAAQQALIRAALKEADITPASVNYVEAHGTGTALGDAIEARALGAVFATKPKSEPLLLGSVKTNVGHLEAAAGIAGLIKVVLALFHNRLPGQVPFEQASPQIPWAELPLEVVDHPRSWPGDRPIAGVSSFGFAGSNAHLILQAPPTTEPLPDAPGTHILRLSAHDAESLQRLRQSYLDWLAANPNVSLRDLCLSAAYGRTHLRHRLAVVADSIEELRNKLATGNYMTGRTQSSTHGESGATPQAKASGYVSGIEPDHSEEPPIHIKVMLPSYPFGGKAHRIDAKPSANHGAALQAMRVLVAEALMVDPEELDPDSSLVEQGADSLVLLGLKTHLSVQHGVELSLTTLADELGTLSAIARTLGETPDTQLKKAPLQQEAREDMEAMVDRKLQDLETRLLRQLERQTPPARRATQTAGKPASERDPFGQLDNPQRRHLDDLIEAVNQRTATSKQRAGENRQILADRRNIWTYYPALKQLCYPLQAASASGSHITDVDGHRYIDLTMGFGAHLFGHNPAFLTEALQKKVAAGFCIGPLDQAAARAARGIARLTGKERVSFFSSGTESVMAAVRLARAATGRHGVVMFAGSYHGHFETVMAASPLNGVGALPAYPGIPEEAVAHTVVLPYGETTSLETIAQRADSLAAVLVEPVQTTQPGLQPIDFLRQLRRLTQERGIVLIFDEIVTGFRAAPDGAQGRFGIEADLAVYGKAIAAGMPVGAVAGTSELMAWLDGGNWRFDDASLPGPTTLFGGTYNKHPLAMAATEAVVERLEAAGPDLQRELDACTTEFARNLNRRFERDALPLRLDHFSSFFRIRHAAELDLLYYHLLLRDVYIWEGRRCFLSTAHSRDDLAQVTEAVVESAVALREGGFIQASGKPARIAVPQTQRPSATRLRLSLAFFGADAEGPGYDHIVACTRIADRNGFEAVWIPERHFHGFGGFSPNPAVLCAALARETQRIGLRAGSIVLPLHHPIRVVEEWAMLDQLSGGRVGLAIGSGWHPRDFVLAPDRYAERRDWTHTQLDQMRRLWRGEKLAITDGEGRQQHVAVYPRPIQAEAPLWLSALNNPETFRRAGQLGLAVITTLITQTPAQLTANIQRYRKALSVAGHDEQQGKVTLYLHTYVDRDDASAAAVAREPFRRYLETFVEMRDGEASSEHLLHNAYERYLETASLIGGPERCQRKLTELEAIGVDEIACLVDFGLPETHVLKGLERLATLQRREIGATGVTLTADQRQLLFPARLDPANMLAYQDLTHLRITGPLDVRQLERAIELTFTRQPITRLVPHRASERDVHLIEPNQLAPLTLLEGQPTTQWLQHLAASPLRFEQPLIQPLLVRVSHREHHLLLRTHQAVLDEEATRLFLEETTAYYEAQKQGRQANLPPASDYWHWHARQGGKPGQDLTHLGTHPPISFPTDRLRPRLKTWLGRRDQHRLPDDLARTLSQQRHTPFILGYAAYLRLLQLMTGETHLVTGIYAACRNDAETRHMLGPLLNLVPVAIQMPRTGTVDDYLQQVAKATYTALDHQHERYPALLQRLAPPRDPSQTPLLATTFNFERHEGGPHLGHRTERLIAPAGGVPFDLGYHLHLSGDTAQLICDYNRDLYEPQTIARWSETIEVLLGQLLEHPDRPITSLYPPIPRPHGTPRNPRPRDTVPQRIAERARNHPNAPVLTDRAGPLTLKQLMTRVETLAGLLRENGIGLEKTVAIVAPRDRTAIIAMLAVQRAEGAYLMLDPAAPPARIEAQLAEYQPALLLSNTPYRVTCPIIRLDAEGSTPAPPQRALPSEAAAYLVSTSGTTGRPKAVVVSHGALASYLEAMAAALGMPSDTRYGLVSPLTVDLSYTQLYLPLIFGGQLNLIPPETARDPKTFAAYPAHPVDYLQIVPSHLQALLSETALPQHTLVLTGEACPASLVRQIAEYRPQLRQINAYGPTEATVHATARTVDAQLASHIDPLPLGQPLGNSYHYLLGRSMRPSLTGAQGEIYLGGHGLARGYAGQPALTADRFVPDPYATEPGARLYRTGDRARWRGGELLYLGRTDTQTKIRGYRVEPGEIEATLRAQAGVEGAAVITREHAGRRSLVAFISGSVDIEQINAALAQQLPDHMRPGHIERLQHIPLTAGGKLDRAVLARFPLSQPRAHTPPVNPTQRRIALAWAEVLGRDAIDIHTSFFRLGGDSLSAITLVARLRTDGWELATLDLFQAPTIAALAERLTPSQPQTPCTCECERPKRTPLQQAILHQSQRWADLPIYHNSNRMVVIGELDPARFQQICQSGPGPRPAYRYTDLSTLEVPQRRARIATYWHDEKSHPFNLEQGPWQRMHLIRANPERHIWLWSYHHLQLDGWSFALLLRQILARYRGQAQPPERNTNIPQPREDARQAVRQFWQEHLHGLTEPTPLPATTRPAGRPDFSQQTRHFPAGLGSALEQYARHHDLTPALLCASAWGLLLARHADRNEVVFGMVHANRPSPHAIGSYAVALPARLHIAPADALLPWLKANHQDQARRDAHARIDPEELRRCSHIPGEQPLFETMLAFANHPEPDDDGTPQVRIEASYQTTHVPLLLVIDPRQGYSLSSTYDRELWTEAEMARLLQQWIDLLAELATDTAIYLADLLHGPTLCPAPQPASLASPYVPLLERIIARAAAQPQQPALIAAADQRDYGTVIQQVRHGAAHLRAHGVGPGSVVAVNTEAGPDLVVAQLAVQAAGATYLALDPHWPAARRAQILDQCPNTLVIDQCLPTAHHLQPLASPYFADSSEPAYLTFTSGTTGTPKGATVSHGTLANLIEDLQPSDMTTLQYAAPGFDVYQQEVFGTLCYGGTLVIPTPEQRTDLTRLKRLIAAEHIERLYLPYLVLRELAQTGEPLPTRVHEIHVAGERFALDPKLREWLTQTEIRITNQYGPCETHVVTLAEAKEIAQTSVPIGNPIAGVGVYLLDSRQRPVPPGAPGQIHLAGPVLDGGHYHTAHLTAASWLPDPYADRGGARMYATGDWARHLPDGQLLYLGRRDRQVKVAGMRIELAEVEGALSQHPKVSEARVIAQHQPGGTSLTAYVCGETSELASWLAERLPAPMRPTTYILLDRIPRTDHGKTALAQLPRPANPRHIAIEGAMRQVLALAPETPLHTHNFFALGGNSLSAARLAERLNREHGCRLGIADIMAHPNLAELAERIGGETRVARQWNRAAQRIWYREQLHPARPLFNLSHHRRVCGPLSLLHLAQALAATTQRYPELHSAVREGETGLFMAPTASPRPLLVDLTGLAEAEAILHPLAAREAHQPFRLDRQPPLRMTLFRLGPAEHVWLESIHHMAADAPSLEQYRRELAANYAASMAGEPLAQEEATAIELPEPDEQARRYWQTELAEAPQPSLPRGRVTTPQTTGAGARHPLALTENHRAGLERLVRDQGATPAMITQALWLALLRYVCGSDDLLVGMPVNLREAGQADAFGCLVETLPVHYRLHGAMTLDELLHIVRTTNARALRHRHGLPSHHPTPTIGFNWQDTVSAEPPLPGLTQKPLDQPITHTRWDLSLNLFGRALTGNIEYSRERIDEATVATLAQRYVRILTAAFTETNIRLDALPYLTAEERQRLLTRFAGEGHAPPSQPFHTAFLEYARRQPEAAAIDALAEQRSLSYGQLRDEVMGLAGLLQRYGCRLEDTVALHLDPGASLAGAMLACSLVGTAFTVLDPAWPASRITTLLERSNPVLVLTRGPNRIAVDPPVIDLMTLAENPAPITRRTFPPERLAWIAFTSGSSGEPEGVLTTHAGASHYLADLRQRWQLGSGDVVLQLAAPGFDAVARDLIGPLTSGARVVVPDPATKRDDRALLALIRQHAVTGLLSLTPSLLLVLAQAVPNPITSVRLLLLSGEALYAHHVHAARKVFGERVVIVNQYGPTETTLTATRHVILPDSAIQNPIPLGRAFGLGECYLLRDDELVPDGSTGEICLAGPGLARGYLGKPRRTALAYRPHPFAGRGTIAAGARLYHTHDQARATAAGLTYLGRSDRLIKLRGQRLHPAEIEAVLQSHPGITAALVRVEHKGNLKAYLETREALEPNTLHQWCRTRLPAHMVPNTYQLMDQLPRKANGKLDPKALTTTERPTNLTPSEQTLASHWCDLLGIDRVQPHDVFFDLGGHSLLAMRLVAAVRRATGRELPLARILEGATLAELARLLETTPANPSVANEQAQPQLTTHQKGLWFDYQHRGPDPAYHLDDIHRLQGPLDVAALERALQTLLAHHETLRYCLLGRGAEPRHQPIPIETYRLSCLDIPGGIDPVMLLTQHCNTPIDLAQGPLRINLIRQEPAQHLLVIQLHHIAADAHSIVVLRHGLSTCYAAEVTGTPATLPVLNQPVIPTVTEQDSNYWREQWRDYTHTPIRVEPQSKPGSGSQLIEVNPLITHLLCDYARRARVSDHALLLSTFAWTLAERLDRETLVVGTPVTLRAPSDDHRIGLFVNPLPLRLTRTDHFPDFLAQVWQVHLTALTHRHLPYHEIATHMGGTPGHSPLQLMFTYHERLPDPFALQGVTVQKLATEQAAKYPLALTITRHDDRLELHLHHQQHHIGSHIVATLGHQLHHFLTDLALTNEQALTRWLQQQWAEVLGCEDIPHTTPFDHLGGHSLATLALRERLEHALARELPLQALLTNPTLNNQAHYLTTLLTHRQSSRNRRPG